MNGNSKKPSDLSRVYAWIKSPDQAYLAKCEDMFVVLSMKAVVKGKILPPGWVFIPSTPLPRFEVKSFQINGFDMPKGIGRNE